MVQSLYSRAAPSPRYLQLADLYAQAHSDGLDAIPSEKLFDGASFAPHIPQIKRLIAETGSRTMLDYGSGKATAVPERARLLGLESITCYDPGVPEFSVFPDGKFDIVISTDVMEHVPEEDLPWVIREIFAAANKCVFANIANFPAAKVLPNGWNAHITLKPLPWWRDLFAAIARDFPHVRYEALVTEVETRSFGSTLAARLKGKTPKPKFVSAEFSSAPA